MTEKKSPPREISIRGATHAAIKARAEENGVGPLIDWLITDYLDKEGVVDIGVDTYDAIMIKAEEKGITSRRLVDRIVANYLDRMGVPK